MSDAGKSGKSPSPPSKRRISRADLAAAVAGAGLAVPQPDASALSGTVIPRDEILVSTIRLTLDQVDPFEHNPRTWHNEKFLDIKESIRARGLDTLMWVTRRPGSKRYVLAKGGGTRYAALKELWRETQNRKFFEIDFNFCEYVSEANILAGHMSENINRGEMCFWDKAQGYINLKHEVESEFGNMTFDGMAAKFKELGIPDLSRSLMALYQFTFDHLGPLGESVYRTTMVSVRNTLQPSYNLYLRLLQLAPVAIDFEEQIWIPALARVDQDNPTADWDVLIADIDNALAQALSLDVEKLRTMLQALKPVATRKDAITWGELLPPAPTRPSPPPSPKEAAEEESGERTAEAGDDGGTGAGEPNADTPHVSGVRVRQMPGALPRLAPEDGDRPPAAIVAQVEAEQRHRAAEASGASAGTSPSLPVVPDVTVTGAMAESPAYARSSPPATSSLEQHKRRVLELAIQLASHSKTLDGLIVEQDALPVGWLVDLPQDVLTGTPLPPLAKQIYWFLARASFQVHIGLHQPERIAGTRFADFLQGSSGPQWSLVQPDDGFDFLMGWLIDPQHVALAVPAIRMLTITRELLANHPDKFLDLAHMLDFQDLQESHQAERLKQEQEALDYCVQAGASPDLMRRLFPSADLSGIRYRPGRVAEIDLKTAQRLYDVWDDLRLQVASEKQRYIRLHQIFPDISMASLWSAINGLG